MSTYNPYAAAGQGNYTTLTSGKMLGGCDSLNHFYFVRGCPSDFDGWAEITKDDSWKYENFIEYFKKSERLEDDEIKAKYPEYHGTDGPIGLTRQPSDELDSYLKAFAEIGHPTVLDLNSNTNLGYSQPQYTIAEKIRQTSAYAYLQRVKDHANFYVSKNTRVTKVLFEFTTAVAVEAIYEESKYILRANKEIILCAGVFNTPQILMLSGIGPVDHLNDAGINVLANLPVGNGLTDQVATTLVHKTIEHDSVQVNIVGVDPDLSRIPFAVTIGNVAINESQKCPDYQAYGLLFRYDTQLLTFICKDIFFYRNEICDRWQREVQGRDSLYTLIANVAPKSRGTVRLNLTDILGDPVITTAYYTDTEDLDNMVKYVRDYIKVGNTTFFKNIGAKLVGLDLPECAHLESDSDEFWRCYIRNTAHSPYHSVGTCPMGSVIDGNLKVKGFQNIRVMDASAMPKTPSAGGNPAVLALAEKGAYMAAETFVTLQKSEFDYNYLSTYDPAGSSHDFHFTLPGGKMLGGTDSLNHAYVTRGSPCDYDRWADITGDSSWRYENLLKYFIKSERLEDDEITENYPQFHGTNGPIGIIRQLADQDKLNDYFNALAEVGHPTVLDQNAEGAQGYALAQYMLADKMRQTPAVVYLQKVKNNTNFFVSKNTRVIRVLFENTVAVAVEAIYEGETYILRANKEIILCAGVFNTPQILMLSGIGHAEHLSAANINIISDLPVGDNLADHFGSIIVYKTKQYDLPPANPTGLSTDLSTVPFAFCTGSVPLNKSQNFADYLGYLLVLTHDTPQLTLVCHNTFWYKNEICDRLQQQIVGYDALYCAILHANPLSRGFVRLNISDPLSNPVITTAYLSRVEDLDDMVKFIKDIDEIRNSSFFNQTGADIIGLDLPECVNETLYSDEYWKCYVLNMLFSPYHFTGTCAMGSVVDGDLNVLGFKSLRAVDASVIPISPRAGTNAAVIAIAEKAADKIKSQLNNK